MAMECCICGNDAAGGGTVAELGGKPCCQNCRWQLHNLRSGSGDADAFGWARAALSRNGLSDDVRAFLEGVSDPDKAAEFKARTEERLRREAEEGRERAAAMRAEYASRRMNFIVTTTPGVEGRRVESYIGLVSAVDYFNPVGFVGESLADRGNRLAGSATARATEEMAATAIDLGADAVVGVSVGITSAPPMMYVHMSGTAVKLGPAGE